MSGTAGNNVQRTAANIQNSHHKYMNESKLVLQKHVDLVQSLRQEREHLLRELGSTGLGGTMNLMDTVKSSGSGPSVGHNSSLDLRRKATQYTDELRILKIKLEAEQNRVQELDKNVAVLQGEQFATRAVMGGVNVRKENHLMFEKQMKVLENRLDQALVRFNDSIAHNKKLRETIDTLRREREVFNEIYQKLERELQEKKHLMSDTIEISNRCYETRDTYVNELERLKVQAQEELTVFNNKLRELDAEAAMILNKEATIEAEREEAISRAKAQRVAATVAAAAAANSVGSNKLTSGGAGSGAHGSNPSGAGVGATVGGGAGSIAGTNTVGATGGNDASGAGGALDVSKQHTATHYQEMLEQLREATGVQDLKKLQEKFRAVEESNFSMYNYIHGLNKEIESMEEEIESLQESMHSDKGDPVIRRALHELELELAQTESVQLAYEEKNHVIRGQLETLRHTLQEIMMKVGCISPLVGKRDGSDSPTAGDGSVPIPNEISERNMHEFLALLERRTTELIHKQVAILRRKQLEKSLVGDAPNSEHPRMSPRAGKPTQWGEEEDAQAPSRVPVPPHRGGTTPNIQQLITTHGLPSTGDGFGNDGGEDGEDDRVLSEKELRERIERRLSAKTQQEGGMERGERRRGKGGAVNTGAAGAGKYAK